MLGNKSFDEILFESLQKFSTVLKVGDLEVGQARKIDKF